MKNKGIVILRSYYDSIKYCSKDEQCDLWNAIFEYTFEEKEPELSGPACGLWIALKPNIDSSLKRYENSIINGSKGGRPPKQPKDNQTITKEEPTNNPTPNLEKEKDKEKDKEKEKDILLNHKGLKGNNGGFGKLLEVFPPTKVRNELDCLVLWDRFEQKEKQQIIRHSSMYVKNLVDKGEEKYIKTLQGYLESGMWKDMKPKVKQEVGSTKTGMIDYNFYKYVVYCLGELEEFSTEDLAIKNIHTIDDKMKTELWLEYQKTKPTI